MHYDNGAERLEARSICYTLSRYSLDLTWHLHEIAYGDVRSVRIL